MALSVTRQQPTQHDFVWPENSELTATITCTVTPTASVTSPTITLRRAVGGAAWTDVTPTISVNTNVITLAFTAADAAELRAAGGLLYEIAGTVGGDGPFPLVAGRVAPTAAGTAGGSSTTSATLAVTVGAAAVSLAIALGGSGGGGGASALSGLSDVTITAAADGDVLSHNGTDWVDVTRASLATDTAFSSRYVPRPASDGTAGQALKITSTGPLVTEWGAVSGGSSVGGDLYLFANYI